MKIGIPKEIKQAENRISCTPGGVRMLVTQEHEVFVEKNGGIGAGFSDEQYEQAGAKIISDAAEIWSSSDMIMKVKEPLQEEFQYLRKDLILFTFLHLAAAPELTKALLKSECVGLAYETVQVNRRLPLLEPMSEIAGRMSAIVGANYLSKASGGKGVLLGGVPGVLPGRVLVIGGGTAGINAGRIAAGIGAEVTILEVDLEKMRFLDITLHSSTHTLYSNEQNLLEELPRVDLLIGAVLLPGSKAPKLIRREMLEQMRPGSVLVDIAIDQGGCAETSRATTHQEPTYVENGVVHYCVANMPGAFSRTATQALTNVTLPYAQKIAGLGLAESMRKFPELIGGVNTMNGKLCHEAVAEVFPNLPFEEIKI